MTATTNPAAAPPVAAVPCDGSPVASHGIPGVESSRSAPGPKFPVAVPLGEVRPATGEHPRSWTIEMPARMRLLSLNGRIHYRERNRRTAVLKDAACVLARQQRIPALERISVLVEYQPPDRRHRDADNAATASGKPCIDGLVMAGVIADDESPLYVTEVTYRIGPMHPGGRLVLTITEVLP